jgi:hypothetical protein
MARVVVLSFRDNDAAEAVVQAVDELQQTEPPISANEYVERIQRLGSIMAAGATPQALLARPTKGCTCSRKHEPWKKTPRFGWFICPECRLPSVIVVRKFMANLIISGGNNLLKELRDKLAKEKEEPEVPMPEGQRQFAAVEQYLAHPERFEVEGTITGRLPAPEGSVHEPPLQ